MALFPQFWRQETAQWPRSRFIGPVIEANQSERHFYDKPVIRPLVFTLAGIAKPLATFRG